MKACCVLSPRSSSRRASAFALRVLSAVLLICLFAVPASYAGSVKGGLGPAIDAAQAKGTVASAQALSTSIRSNPDDPLSDMALYTLGSVYLKNKDYPRAATAFQGLIETFPASSYKFPSLYDLGYARYRSGRMTDARSVLEAVADGADTSEELRGRARILLAEMSGAISASGFNPAADHAAMQDGGAAPIVIGALLPVKGPYAVFGTDALNGILLAADVFGNGQGQGGVKVVARDVGTDSESAASAVSELAGDRTVGGLIGPLFSSSAANAAKLAQSNGIPIVTLTQKEGITSAGDFVFRNFLTPEAQAVAIAEYACDTLGLQRFAILAPQNNYGNELAKFFEAELKKCGASVVKSAQYRQGATDFSAEVRRLFGVQVEVRKEGRRKIKEYTPVSKIQALFIPDGAETVALIVPYLRYYNVKGVQLLGTNGWNSQRLVELGGESVEGAVFVDGFFPESKRPGASEFARRFNEVYGRPPGVIEAQAYDAAAMLISAIRLSGGASADRQAVKKRLRSIGDYTGAAGIVSFDGSGEAVKRLFYLTVKDGRITEAR